MDQCQVESIDELKIPNDIHHETNIKSIKHINIKKSTIESDHRTPKRKSDISNSNFLKKKKKYETALAAIFPENDQSYLQYAQDYAEGYMKKMRERLDAESFDLAIKLIVSFGIADDSNINLFYQQITEIFTDKNEDLIYEFLGFLLPGQALLIGKLTDFLELNRIKEFIRKLQVCMKKQPTQVRKILDNLLNLSKIENITPLEVHSSMLSLLKSNPVLVDCFFQLIPTEHPPESFFSDDNWEDLDIDQSINCGIDYEEIILSDSEDHLLLNICQCKCHKLGDNRHCRSCGLKFFKGRIYFDTPEGLKLAKINFEGADSSIVYSKIDKTEENVTVKRKNRKNLTKNNSPGSAEDIKGSTGTESEEDLIDIKPKKRQKSKVVQSLKLKFKKDESPKFKDDQEICYNEVGKSIVHITNEELDSSEMVFFCIPKAEPTIKILPTKKLKDDIKECLLKKEHEVINQNNQESHKINNLNAIVHKKSNVIIDQIKLNTIEFDDNLNSVKIERDNEVNTDYLEKNTINKEVKTEYTHIPLNNTVNSIPNIDNKCSQYQQESTESVIRLFDPTSIINSEFSDNCNQFYKNHQENSNKISKQLIKKELNNDLDCCNSINKKQCDNQDTSFKSTTVDCISAYKSTPSYDNESKIIENKSEKQSINKWTIDEDKIILQTCKRVEDIEVLLETINRRIPRRSVSEIQERFTTLMTLLEQMIDVKQV